ncbi:MAG: S9 family peptidase [Sporolactobacillus sp.]
MAKLKVSADDLYRLTFVGSPAISTDGQKIVYVATHASEQWNSYCSELYLCDRSGINYRLTSNDGAKQAVRYGKPCFSADGQTLYFLSNRSGNNQVWSIAIGGGEAQLLTHFTEAVSEFTVSTDEHVLVCCTHMPDRDESGGNSDVSVVTRLRYLQNGTGLVTGSNALFLIDLPSGEPTLITAENGEAHSPCISADGSTVYFLQTQVTTDHYLPQICRYQRATKMTTCLYQAKGSIGSLQLSPNGHLLAFSGTEDGECSPKNIAIYLLPSDGGHPKWLTADEDLSIGNFIGTDARYDSDSPSFRWRESSEAIDYLVQRGRICGIRQINMDGKITDISMAGGEVITSFDVRGGQIAAVISSPLSTGELIAMDSTGALRQPLTNLNQDFFADHELAKPIPFTYEGADGWPMDGYLLLPPVNAESSKKIPVVLEIHGGPASAYGDAFNHEFQLLAAFGYAVVYTNPRGSRGYGEAFCAGCYNDWGRKDREDILLGLDAALKRFSQLDPSRQFVTGGSYGGFMTNTIVGHTDRFRAAVTQRSICNLYSFFGTSDIGYYFLNRYFDGADLWTDEEKLMQFSPIRYARNVHTPICIIHSERDDRCPIEQAEQWYIALRRLGVDTRFVRIKGENHELSRSGKPKNRISRLNEIVGWFERYR